MLIDLHVHTELSACSDLRIEDIVALSKQRGLDGVCITDHHTMCVRETIAEGCQDNGLLAIFGMEYTTDGGDFLLFGPFENLELDLTAAELLPRVAELGGVAVSAHPYRLGQPADTSLFDKGLVFCAEAVNGRNSGMENMAAQDLIAERRLTATGGSDAHRLWEIAKVGARFQSAIETRDDLIRALKAGACAPETLRPGDYPID